MFLSETDLENQVKLKQVLQHEITPPQFESLAAALLGQLLGVSIAVAKSGFQHGGDAGPAGRQGRRFRLECKRYSDTTSLSDRELLGEIDDALARDNSLEAWFLVATRNVPEQLEQALTQKGERIGVPVVIIDWKDHELAPLAALCAFDPDLVETEFSKEAGAPARALRTVSADVIAMLRHDLQSWCLGFESLRLQSHKKLDYIWTSPRTSNAELGQDAAGGAQVKRVKRSTVFQNLNDWWQGPATTDAPAAVIGWDGVGKTWATLDWLVDNKYEQPITLIVPSSAAAILSNISETSVKRFLADRLYEVCGVRNSEHWLHRLDYLLKRPIDEGPVLTVFFDGLNQEPSVPWLLLLKVLQAPNFAGRVRVIISTRNLHFDDQSKFRGLTVPVEPVVVDLYDQTPGGELDQMLAFEGLTQADLHPDLIELACTPRLFKLVVRFRDRLVEANQVTVHRLLWEYGRDTFGERAGKSFSETDWQDWLKEIAGKYLDGIQKFTRKSLSETASRPDLSEKEIYARLSDIIDGRFANRDPSDSLQLSPAVVAHALGVALLAHLHAIAAPTFATVDVELNQWLDPIAGLDQRAEILRAAVSILVEQGFSTSPVAGVLVTAWLQTQNVNDIHRLELAALAPFLTDALFDAVEHSENSTFASARLWAINAMRAIPKTDVAALESIVTRASRWFSIVSRNIHSYPGNKEFAKNRSDHFKSRVGIDSSGSIKVIGVDLELVDQADSVLQMTAPSIIEGFPLTKALPVFEVAAVALPIKRSSEGWDGLKWLCLLNEIDPDETAMALRELAENVRSRTPEPDVHNELPAKIASLLLLLSGEDQDEDIATAIDPGIDSSISYEKDYLNRPSRSFFRLERRHAEIVLRDRELSLFVRVQRTKELWLDPSFEPPDAFIAEVRAAAAYIEVDKLDRHRGHTSEDHHFEVLEPVLARCAPDLLADLIRRKMQGFAACPAESRYRSANRATEYLILVGKEEASSATILRQSNIDPDSNNECFAASSLLMVELKELDVRTQFDTLISADLKFIWTDFEEILRVPTPDDVDALIDHYAGASPKQQGDLLILLSFHPVCFSDKAWSWLMGFTKAVDFHRYVAFATLTRADALRFGRILLSEHWSWSLSEDVKINHYGSYALIEATRGLPFEQVAPRLAPWRLLEAARLRGADSAEVRLAAEIFGHVLAAKKIDEPDPGAILSVDRTESKSSPFLFSVSPRPSEEESNDPMLAFKAAMDADKQNEVYRRAAETAASRIREARKSGASLYLTYIDKEDFEPVLQHASDRVELWLEGLCERSTDFRRRVILAESAFLALCEALLIHDPVPGAQLWRALRARVTTRYIGAAGVEELLHIVFRVPDSPAVTALRQELIGLENCHTDQALFDLAVAASYNGRADWLAAVIKTDQASALVWKRKRGVVLEGFTTDNRLPVEAAWPDGETKTNYAELNRKLAHFRWNEACTHHWWRIYLSAQDPGEAYAAWVLFLRSADRRAWIWMREDVQTTNNASQFFQLKLSHVWLNRSELERAMKKRTDKLGESFLDRKTVMGIGPWGKDTGSA